MTEKFSIDEVMFICGAQTTPDGEMVPQTFMVFSAYTEPEDAAVAIVKKIVEDLETLDIDSAAGSMEFVPVKTWQDFADIKMDDTTKTKALIAGVMKEFLGNLIESKNIDELAAFPWLADEPEKV